jgi:hypothetical protein
MKTTTTTVRRAGTTNADDSEARRLENSGNSSEALSRPRVRMLDPWPEPLSFMRNTLHEKIAAPRHIPIRPPSA